MLYFGRKWLFLPINEPMGNIFSNFLGISKRLGSFTAEEFTNESINPSFPPSGPATGPFNGLHRESNF